VWRLSSCGQNPGQHGHKSDDVDVLDFVADPNCLQCLERMQLVVGGFWCESCEVAVRAEDPD